jgi:hypothetical protein
VRNAPGHRQHSTKPQAAGTGDKSLKREIDIEGKPFMLTISPEGLKLVPKGKRNGLEIAWKDLVSGDAALATALNASLKV